MWRRAPIPTATQCRSAESSSETCRRFNVPSHRGVLVATDQAAVARVLGMAAVLSLPVSIAQHNCLQPGRHAILCSIVLGLVCLMRNTHSWV